MYPGIEHEGVVAGAGEKIPLIAALSSIDLHGNLVSNICCNSRLV
jgi:hypothetical protein